MSRAGPTRILAIGAAFAVAAAVFTAVRLEHHAANASFNESHAADRMLVALLEQESALRGLALTGKSSFLDSYRRGVHDFESSVHAVEKGSAGDPEELRELDTQVTAVHKWQVRAEAALAHFQGSGHTRPSDAGFTRSKEPVKAREANARLQDILQDERNTHLRRAGLIALALSIMLLLVFGVAYVLIERRRRGEAENRGSEQRYQETQADFTETMQVTRSEEEAYDLLRRHLERSIDESEVVVLNRNNSDNRLEVRTALPENSPLQEELEGAEPNSCLAVRLGRAHERGNGRPSLLECEVCGALPGKSTCIPSLVSGEVIGSVLIRHENRLLQIEQRRVQESVIQAAPVLANLRNLELARIRAATDALTGLGNTRTVRETLKRMVAQAGRTVTMMSLVLIDLDHFKRINDTQGHAKGDEVLAAVGDVLSSETRASDFVGRYGGEEFVALLPSTNRSGAEEIAEKLRLAVSNLRIPGLEQPITASFGVASFPEDAGDADTLMRIADRALYKAKENGRNRVEVATPGTLEAPL
jgi:diguanylate cyclase (GGDEF)-like protein